MPEGRLKNFLKHNHYEIIYEPVRIDRSAYRVLHMRRVYKEFFTNSPQKKNVNIANFILALLLKINKPNELCNLEM